MSKVSGIVLAPERGEALHAVARADDHGMLLLLQIEDAVGPPVAPRLGRAVLVADPRAVAGLDPLDVALDVHVLRPGCFDVRGQDVDGHAVPGVRAGELMAERPVTARGPQGTAR
jgi:hypothetical protein